MQLVIKMILRLKLMKNFIMKIQNEIDKKIKSIINFI